MIICLYFDMPCKRMDNGKTEKLTIIPLYIIYINFYLYSKIKYFESLFILNDEIEKNNIHSINKKIAIKKSYDQILNR